MSKYRVFVGALAFTIALTPTAASAGFFFLVLPIPRGSVNPDRVSATIEQRQLAMCAAFHRSVIDPQIDGKRENSYRGAVTKAAMAQMAGFKDAKKLVSAYIGQWQMQAKQNYESGQSFANLLTNGCKSAGLPVNRPEYETWALLKRYSAPVSQSQPIENRAVAPQVPVTRTDEDPILELAIHRCKEDRSVTTSDMYRQCVRAQIKTLSSDH